VVNVLGGAASRRGKDDAAGLEPQLQHGVRYCHSRRDGSESPFSGGCDYMPRRIATDKEENVHGNFLRQDCEVVGIGRK
jgi:hypothetical protein